MGKDEERKNLDAFRPSEQDETSLRPIQEVDLIECPEVVSRYLRKSGIIGKQRTRLAKIVHTGEMKLSQTGSWISLTGEYRILPLTGSFKWLGYLEFFPGLEISIMDQYQFGKGYSKVSLVSSFEIEHAFGEEIDSSSMGRMLSEMVLVPTSLLPNKNLSWEAGDDLTARAFLSFEGRKVMAIFTFNTEDEIVKVSIDRFRKSENGFPITPFIGEFSNYQNFSGLRIPGEMHGKWIIDSQEFEWVHFQVEEAVFIN
jgi:hypothetical protein